MFLDQTSFLSNFEEEALIGDENEVKSQDLLPQSTNFRLWENFLEKCEVS